MYKRAGRGGVSRMLPHAHTEIILLISCPWHCDQGQNCCETNTCHAQAVSRLAPHEPGPQAQGIHLSWGGMSLESYPHQVPECRSRRTSAVHRPRWASWRRVLYFLIYGFCFAAATATFVVIVLKISQARRASLLSGGTQGITLGIFSTPFITRVSSVTVIFISRLFRDAQRGEQLGPQARSDIRGPIMEAIEASVLYPAILLNVLKTRSEFVAEQGTIDTIYDVSTAVLALGWIALWFSGGRNGQREGTDQVPAAVQSPDDDGSGARGVNHQETQGDASDTSHSSQHGSCLGVAGP